MVFDLKGTEGTRVTETDPASTGSLSKCPRQSGLGQVKVGSPQLSPGSPVFEPWPAASQGAH